MKIKDKSFVSIDYSLTLDSGEEVDKSDPDKPLSFIFNSGQMISGLEKQLDGKEEGFDTQFSVEPEDGYGIHNPELIRKIPRDDFQKDIKPGMAFMTDSPHGQVPFTVKEVEDDVVTIDLNNPLCDERLHFKVKVIEVRDATADELAALTGPCHCDESSCGGCGEH